MCPTLTASMGTQRDQAPLVIDNYGIRKLTLRECLDFQGFPKDFYFPNTITIEDAYKQCGNTVCVPVVKRVAERIIKIITDKEKPVDIDRFFRVDEREYRIVRQFNL